MLLFINSGRSLWNGGLAGKKQEISVVFILCGRVYHEKFKTKTVFHAIQFRLKGTIILLSNYPKNVKQMPAETKRNLI